VLNDGKTFFYVNADILRTLNLKKVLGGKIFEALFSNQRKIVLLSIPLADTFEKEFLTCIRGRGTFFKIAFYKVMLGFQWEPKIT